MTYPEGGDVPKGPGLGLFVASLKLLAGDIVEGLYLPELIPSSSLGWRRLMLGDEGEARADSGETRSSP